jgi:hypothetical protein
LSPGRNLNPGPPEYETGESSIHLRRLVVNITTVIISRRNGWAGPAARMAEMRNINTDAVRKLEGKRPPGWYAVRRWKDNNK